MFPGTHNPEMDTAKEEENKGTTNMPFLNQKEEGVEQNKTEPLSPEHKHHIQSIQSQELTCRALGHSSSTFAHCPSPLLVQNQGCSLSQAQLRLAYTGSSSASSNFFNFEVVYH